MKAHPAELEFLALEDGELEATAAARMREHLKACARCRAFEEGLAHETAALREELAAPAPAPREGAARREFGWVVAAGLTLSVGVLAIRRLFFTARELTDAVPVSDPIPFASWLLTSLLDPVALLQTIAQGGIVLLSLIGIGVLSSVLRRSRKALAPALVVFALLDAPAAEALRILRSGDSEDCRIAAGEVIRDDVLLLCGNTTIAGTVEGDVFALGQTIEVSGRVAGDLIGAAELVEIPGTVDFSVRVAAQRISVSGAIGRSLMVVGQRITVRPGATIGGGATLFGDEVRIEGEIGGNLRAGGDEVRLDASVGGDARTSGGALEFGPRARVNGSATHTGDREPNRPPEGLRVEWDPSDQEAGEDEEGATDVAQRVAVRWAAGALLGLVLALLAGGPLSRVAAAARCPLAPILIGAVLAVAVPILAVLTAITVIGIPIAVLAVLGWAFALYAARIVLGLALGEWILGPGATRLDRFWRIALGLLILCVAVEIPVLGTVVAILTALLGLGAFAVQAYRTVSRRPAGAPETIAPS